MKRSHGMLIVALALGAALFAPTGAQAMSSYYAASCAGCHNATPTTCNGCHRHRGTVTGSLPKATFAPGESFTVTVNAGARSGWWRAAVLDGSNAVVATATATASGAAAVTVKAPTTAGTYSYKAAWYGNKYTETPGAGWVEDATNADHGYLTVALGSFTVESAPPPPNEPVAGLSPAALDLGTVTTGQAAAASAMVSNSGNANLVVSAVTPCSGTNAASLTISPTAGFTVAAGGSATVTVTFAPTAAGAAAACWNLATNDSAHPSLQLNASGTGADSTPPPPTPKPVAGLSPTTLALGTVTTGQAAAKSAVVANTGNADLVVSAVTPCNGSNAASLTISPTAGFTVAAGSSATLTVSFAPTAAGAASACWNLATNDAANASLRLDASGTGAAQPPPPDCTGCHALPPATGKHAFHVTAGEGCGSCHGAGYSSSTVVDATHNNATVDVASSAGWNAAAGSCSNGCHSTKSWGGTSPPPPPASCTSCHATPPNTGKHATHASESCGSCHGTGYSKTTVAAATHRDGKATVASAAGYDAAAKSCSNSCHSTKSWTGGGTTPTACNSCHAMPPTSGRHSLHRSENVACSACHGSGYSTTKVNASTHKNGSVTLSSKVGWNSSKRSCSNSCHGSEKWGSSGGTTPPPTTGCTTCHKIPPASGQHAKHQSKKVNCGTCHGAGYSSSAVNAATHKNGKVDLASKIGFKTSKRTCSNSCHGTERWLGKSGGGDDHEKDDFVVAADETGSGDGEPAAGGCSSAGGALPLLGLLGVALGLRRRRVA